MEAFTFFWYCNTVHLLDHAKKKQPTIVIHLILTFPHTNMLLFYHCTKYIKYVPITSSKYIVLLVNHLI